MSGYVESGMTALCQTVESTIKSTTDAVDSAVEVVTKPEEIPPAPPVPLPTSSAGRAPPA
jgi:hypothetical protein